MSGVPSRAMRANRARSAISLMGVIVPYRGFKHRFHIAGHARAGSWLVDNWCLPKDFSEICAHHHDAPDAGDSEILQLVKVACTIADAIGFPAVKCLQQPSYRDATSPLQPRLGRKAPVTEEDLRANVTARLLAFEG